MSEPRERTQSFQTTKFAWTPNLIGALVLLVLALVLIVQNWGDVTVNLLFWNIEMPLSLLLLLLFVLGGAVGWLLPWVRAESRRSRVRITTSASPNDR